jgi:4-alpha-glucanotransferase
MAKERHDADPEALLLVLRAMGAGLERFDDVDDALARRKEELRLRVVEPVTIAWDGRLGKKRYDFGYHRAELKGRETFIISAPKKAFFPTGSKGRPSRLWGLFAPIYALHSKRNPNTGDLSDFEDLMHWMSDFGGAVAATLPILAAFLDEPFEASPYSPASRLFWNEFYVDPSRVPEFAGSAAAKLLVEQRPKKTKYVDYRAEMRYKRRILEELSRTFFADARPERLQAYGKFIREQRGAEDYAKFRAVTDKQRSGWSKWPAPLRDGTITARDYDEDVKNYYMYSQWVVQEQLESLSSKASQRNQFLYLDLPLGLHSESYDIWHQRDLFVRSAAGGAPPDPVFTKGQNWGFPPMHPEAMRLTNYRYVIAYIRNHLRFARLLRIDHVMGLHRLYWIPNELTGDKGVYVEYPAEELYAILCLESHLHNAGIVGENLGTVPPAVNAGMARHDIRQMYVVQYELAGDPEKATLRRVPKKCVASLNTHDMSPFRAFLQGDDIDDRLDLGFLDGKGARQERRNRKVLRQVLQRLLQKRLGSKTGSDPSALYRGVSEFLADSMANIVLVNVEDLWGEVLPQNVPATSKERPNWRRRIRPSLEQIRRMANVAEELSHVFTDRSRPVPL